MSFQLFEYQQAHFDRLLEIYQNHKVAIDSSITGSGKTVVSLRVGEYFIDNATVSKVIVCAPPTLEFHWKQFIKSTKWMFCSSCSLHKLNEVDYAKSLIIVDECHLFKNSVKRTDLLKKIVNKANRILMLSATPFDDPRQLSNISELFHLQNGKLEDQISRMRFSYNTKTSFDLYHTNQNEDEQKMYNQGLQAICCSWQHQGNANEMAVFRPHIFNKGLHKIHLSLMNGLVRYLKKCMEESPTSKFVVVLYFKDTFEILRKEIGFENIMVLNGDTPCEQRGKIVENFQSPMESGSSNARVCAISAEVGSVGVELDDKSGVCPRHMIILPMSNSINFCQAIGRIQRTKTLSNSRVSVIQPMKRVTYFKKQVEKKFRVLEQFLDPPVWEHVVEEHYPQCSLDSSCSCVI